jgi:hypothetical protein
MQLLACGSLLTLVSRPRTMHRMMCTMGKMGKIPVGKIGKVGKVKGLTREAEQAYLSGVSMSGVSGESGLSVSGIVGIDGIVGIVGVDEAGRGPLAGPVVTASCYIHGMDGMGQGLEIEGICDSKTTTEAQRESMYTVLTTHPHVVYAVSVVSHRYIHT